MDLVAGIEGVGAGIGMPGEVVAIYLRAAEAVDYIWVEDGGSPLVWGAVCCGFEAHVDEAVGGVEREFLDSVHVGAKVGNSGEG